ncbi:hypothetical protein SAM19_00600 [Brevibacillus laterosporus]|nr:hypothetical protein [Brevibacillus laterosporus]
MGSMKIDGGKYITYTERLERSTIQYLQMVHCPLGNVGIGRTILNAIKSYAGDGNVMVHSVFVLDGDKYMVNHGGIISELSHIT